MKVYTAFKQVTFAAAHKRGGQALFSVSWCGSVDCTLLAETVLADVQSTILTFLRNLGFVKMPQNELFKAGKLFPIYVQADKLL